MSAASGNLGAILHAATAINVEFTALVRVVARMRKRRSIVTHEALRDERFCVWGDAITNYAIDPASLGLPSSSPTRLASKTRYINEYRNTGTDLLMIEDEEVVKSTDCLQLDGVGL
ncbi:hypothetical protein BDZ89DRAFT_1049035 [Hymenopellis radicata]|nr:hypothetical protein BDZ89DRAFT_1049035 [Hymenopellis radicata]